MDSLGIDVTVDYLGKKRPHIVRDDAITSTAYDIGAYEYYDTSLDNTTPVVVLSYEKSTYSGFVEELDASESYDPDDDELEYKWTAPSGVTIASDDEPTLSFLTPTVSKVTTLKFNLSVTDGTEEEQRVVSVLVSPYEPDVQELTVTQVEASDYESPYYPENMIDDDEETHWTSDGEDAWVIFKLAEKASLSFLKMAYYGGDEHQGYFDVYASNDKEEWTEVLLDQETCGLSESKQVFEVPNSKATDTYTYVKLVANGNSDDELNTISEVNIYGIYESALSVDGTTDGAKEMTIYPNPAADVVNVSAEAGNGMPETMQIYTTSGRLIQTTTFDGEDSVSVPLSLKGGVYYIKVSFSDGEIIAKPLIVD